jgi:DNA-binding transcriptional MocR family regulator
MKTSEIRALFSVVSRPEVVSLAGGMPAVTALPARRVGLDDRRAGVRDGRQTLQYGSGQGDPRLRERICDVMALEGITGRLAQRGRRHRRLPAGAGPGHPGLLRPG